MTGCIYLCNLTSQKHYNDSISPPNKTARFTASTHSPQIWSQNTIWISKKFKTYWQRSTNLHPTSQWQILMVCMGHQWHTLESTKCTHFTAIKTNQRNNGESQTLLDFFASQKSAVLTYHKSRMVLVTHSDEGYLKGREAQSSTGRNHYPSENVDFPLNNSTILNLEEILKAVMSSAAEAKLSALYKNAKQSKSDKSSN